MPELSRTGFAQDTSTQQRFRHPDLFPRADFALPSLRKRPCMCRVAGRVEPGFHQVGSLMWRLQASPWSGDAHRRQGGIPFFEYWL